MPSAPPKDLIHRFLFENSDIRGEIVSLEKTFHDAISSQSIDPALLPIFGEFLVGASVMADMFKFDGVLTLQARGDGPVPIIMAEANTQGHLRGIAKCSNPGALTYDDNDKLRPLSELVGTGVLTLTLDPAQGKRYQGIVPLEGTDLAAILKHYFEQSEQIPTYVLLFSDAERCGGLFLQCLPMQNITDPEKREELWNTAMQLASTLTKKEFFELEHSAILFRLFHELDCRIFEPKALSFKCSCSKSRSGRALQAVAKEELKALIEEKGSVELDCQFCGARYSYNKEEIAALTDAPNKTLH